MRKKRAQIAYRSREKLIELLEARAPDHQA
jgi:hypothetical protein